MGKICSNCGKELSDNAKFCSKCGSTIKTKNEVKRDFRKGVSLFLFQNNK